MTVAGPHEEVRSLFSETSVSIAALGVVTVNLESNGLGLPALAAEPFGAGTVLAHTLLRAEQCHTVGRWVVSCPADQAHRVADLAGPRWTVEPDALAEPDWRTRARRGRKWSLHGWRGGVARSTVFDEEGDPAELARLAEKYQAEWVVQVRGEAPLVDPGITNALLARADAADPKPPLMYGSIPPGLAGWVFRADFLAELAEKQIHPGFVLGYREWEPTIDLTEQLLAYKPPIEISRLPIRLLADNQHSLAVLRRLAATEVPTDAVTLARTMQRQPAWLVPSAPAEIEIEITTRRSVGHRYRPQPERADLSVEAFERLVDEYARATDLSLITLGGHGDPLLHPQWDTMARRAHAAGIYGISLTTDAVALDAEQTERLLDSPVDILCVTLDAASPATYQAVHAEDLFAEVVGNTERFLARRQQRGQYHPLVVVSMLRTRATLPDFPDFYDRWTTDADGAVITPHTDCAGQLPADDVLNLEPPRRLSCRRLGQRMAVLSDGTFVACTQDFAARQPCGNIASDTILESWQQGPLAQLRETHSQGRWGDLPLCASCKDWHRP